MAKKKGYSVFDVASEMNHVMEYGVVDGTMAYPEECLDLSLREEDLVDEVLKRAEEDLRLGDQDSFSSEAWSWFEEHDVLPDEGIGVDREVEEDDEEEEEEEEDRTPKKKKQKKVVKEPPVKKSAKEEHTSKKSSKKEKGLSNEALAIQMAKEGKSLEDFALAYASRYPNKDADFISVRVQIYYKIGYKKAGKR